MLLFDILGILIWLVPVVGLITAALIYSFSGVGKDGTENRRAKALNAAIALWVVATLTHGVCIARWMVIIDVEQNHLNEMVAFYEELKDQLNGGSEMKPATIRIDELERHFNSCSMFCQHYYDCADKLELQTTDENEIAVVCGKHPLAKDGTPYGLLGNPLTAGEKTLEVGA